MVLQAETSAFTDAELKRAEAAALVERRMAAMEATISKRRNLPVAAPEPQAARGPGADLRFQVSFMSKTVHTPASHVLCYAYHNNEAGHSWIPDPFMDNDGQ